MGLDLGHIELRPPADADAADALALLTDPDVVKWNPAPRVVDLASAVEWCRSGADWVAGTHATWSAVDARSGRLVANCSIGAFDLDHRSAKIGYRVAPWARNHGVGRHVVDAAAHWSFHNLGLHRIALEHATVNVASCRVATASGFVFEGTERAAYVDPDDVPHDCHLHARLATDPWPPSRCKVTSP